MPTSAEAARLPYREAIDYFRQKVNVPSRHWTTLMDEAHARGFAVAGAADKALIEDFRAAVDKAISQGTGFKAFQKDFDAIVAKHGWVHHGHPQWRARVIYETNMSTAAAAGRYAQATQPEVLRAFPYWEWYHTPVEHPRPQHVAWSGMVLRADDPFWDTHYPPCGWGCRCIVMSLSEGDLRRRGKSGPDASPKIEWRDYINKTTGVVTKVPTGVDPGFVGNPGKIWKEGAKAPVKDATLVPVTTPTDAQAVIKKARGFSSEQAVDQIFTKIYQAWADSGTDAERDALATYKGTLGIQMNNGLRGINPNPVLEDEAKELEKFLARARSPFDLKVWRGVRQPELRMLGEMNVGDSVVYKGFISTALIKERTVEFVGRDQVVIRLIVPAGTKGAAYVHPFPQPGFPQAEFLLNAGTRLRMIEKTDTLWTLCVESDDADGGGENDPR
jgi:hypothetical protein